LNWSLGGASVRKFWGWAGQGKKYGKVGQKATGGGLSGRHYQKNMCRGIRKQKLAKTAAVVEKQNPTGRLSIGSARKKFKRK